MDFYLFVDWMLQRVSPGTAEQYRRFIWRFLNKYSFNITDISDKQIEDYIRNGLGDEQGVKSSCIGRRAALKMFRKWVKKEMGVTWGECIDDIELPRASKRLPDHMTNVEIVKFLDAAASTEERAMWEVMHCAGLRAAELCGLKYGDVDLEESTITVIGKGDKQRKCYLSASATEWLLQHIATTKSFSEWSDDELLFKWKNGGKITDSKLGYMFRECAKRAGIERNVHPHMMRHSFATKLLRSGVDIFTIKDMMGHSSINTTQVYLSVENEASKRAFEKAFGKIDAKDDRDKGNKEEK